MSNSLEKEHLESLVQYYKSKCFQMEYDFVSYKISTEQTLREMSKTMKHIEENHQKEKLKILAKGKEAKKVVVLPKKTKNI